MHLFATTVASTIMKASETDDCGGIEGGLVESQRSHSFTISSEDPEVFLACLVEFGEAYCFRTNLLRYDSK